MIKVYEVTNLLYYGATILDAPGPINNQDAFSADNLIENLAVRSPKNAYTPIIDDQGNKANFNSCFVTNEA